MTVTSKSGDVGDFDCENVNVTAAKDVDLNATKAIKLDGDTGVAVTSKSGDVGLTSTAAKVTVAAKTDVTVDGDGSDHIEVW